MESKVHKVLIVDDEDMIRELIVMELEDQGFNCTEAQDAQQALDILKDNDFDLILTDAQMPNISGIEFIQKIKQDDRFNQIPVILMSGYAGVKDDALKELGLASIIQKPFQVSEIIKILSTFV